MKRRELLARGLSISAAALLWPLQGLANTVLSQLGPATPLYIQKYFQRLLKFSDKEFYSFSKTFSADEKLLIETWTKLLKEWGQSNSGRFFEFFLFSHQLKDSKLNSSRLAIGHHRWTPQALALTNKVLKRHGISSLGQDSESDQFYGIGWDFEQSHIKVYRLHTNPTLADKHLLEFSQAHSDPEIWASERISAVTYQKGKVVKKKLIVPLKEMDWSLPEKKVNLDVYSAMKILECGPNGEVLPPRWHYRLRSFFLGLSSQKMHPAISKHYTEFDQLMDSVIYESPEQMTAYYP